MKKLTYFSFLTFAAFVLITSMPAISSAQLSAPDALKLLTDKKINDELELSKSQIEDVRNLQKELLEGNAKMRNEIREFSDLPKEVMREKIDEYREKFEKLKKDVQKRLDKVLLPEQKKRLDQIVFRMKTARRQKREFSGLLNDDIVERLEITELQQVRIRKRTEKVLKELEEKIAKLREEAREEILEELTKKHRKQYKELVGDPINVKR